MALGNNNNGNNGTEMQNMDGSANTASTQATPPASSSIDNSYNRWVFTTVRMSNAINGISPLNVGINIANRLAPAAQRLSLLSTYWSMVLTTLTSCIASVPSNQIALTRLAIHQFQNPGGNGAVVGTNDTASMDSTSSKSTSSVTL